MFGERNVIKTKWYRYIRICLFSLLVASFSKNACEQSGVYLEIDYLHWKPRQDQIFYASMIPGGVTNPNDIFNNSIVLVDQRANSDSGVRAKIGYTFCRDMDTRIAVTHFDDCAFGGVNVPNGVLATAILPAEGLQSVIGSEATSRWNLHYNAVDWELGRYWDLCEKLALRCHIGLKWAKIKQSQFVNYPSFGQSSSATVDKCNSFRGVGPRLGFNADWCFWHSLSLIGNASFALLYGKFQGNTTINYMQNNTRVTPSSPFCRKRLRPQAEILVGINWKLEGCNLSDYCGWDEVNFNIGLGYEAQYWWSQWQTINGIVQIFASVPGSGDLTFQGLTVWGSLEF